MQPGDAILIAFSAEDVWTRKCTVYGQIIDVHQGALKDIHVTYTARAYNNSQLPADQTFTSISGQFTIGDVSVDLDH